VFFSWERGYPANWRNLDLFTVFCSVVFREVVLVLLRLCIDMFVYVHLGLKCGTKLKMHSCVGILEMIPSGVGGEESIQYL